jgi:hypothetical protein
MRCKVHHCLCEASRPCRSATQCSPPRAPAHASAAPAAALPTCRRSLSSRPRPAAPEALPARPGMREASPAVPGKVPACQASSSAAAQSQRQYAPPPVRASAPQAFPAKHSTYPQSLLTTETCYNNRKLYYTQSNKSKQNESKRQAFRKSKPGPRSIGRDLNPCCRLCW